MNGKKFQLMKSKESRELMKFSERVIKKIERVTFFDLCLSTPKLQTYPHQIRVSAPIHLLLTAMQSAKFHQAVLKGVYKGRLRSRRPLLLILPFASGIYQKKIITSFGKARLRTILAMQLPLSEEGQNSLDTKLQIQGLEPGAIEHLRKNYKTMDLFASSYNQEKSSLSLDTISSFMSKQILINGEVDEIVGISLVDSQCLRLCTKTSKTVNVLFKLNLAVLRAQTFIDQNYHMTLFNNMVVTSDNEGAVTMPADEFALTKLNLLLTNRSSQVKVGLVLTLLMKLDSTLTCASYFVLGKDTLMLAEVSSTQLDTSYATSKIVRLDEDDDLSTEIADLLKNLEYVYWLIRMLNGTDEQARQILNKDNYSTSIWFLESDSEHAGMVGRDEF
jgi:hypothetical protein